MMMCSFFSGSRSLFKRAKVMEGVEYLYVEQVFF